MYPIFVYGTLRPGGSNYRVIEPFVQRPTSTALGYLAGFEMYSCGPYPAAVRTNNALDEVIGNIIWLDPTKYADALDSLDTFESVGTGLYERTLVSVKRNAIVNYSGSMPQEPTLCWMYVVPEARVRAVKDRYTYVPKGNWIEYQYNLKQGHGASNVAHLATPTNPATRNEPWDYD